MIKNLMYLLKSIAAVTCLIILSACGGGGGGSCTPSPTVGLSYKDSRVADQNSWSNSNIVFPSLTKVTFLPSLIDMCQKKASFFGTSKSNYRYGNTYSRYIGNGLEMSEDGIISGIPEKTGVYTYYIGVEVEGYKGYAMTTLEVRVDDFGFNYYQNNLYGIKGKVGEDLKIEPTMTDGYWESLVKDKPEFENGQTNLMRGSFLPAGVEMDFSVENGVLPLGLALDAATGKIYGKPIESGNFNISITMRASNSEDTQAAENGYVNIYISP